MTASIATALHAYFVAVTRLDALVDSSDDVAVETAMAYRAKTLGEALEAGATQAQVDATRWEALDS